MARVTTALVPAMMQAGVNRVVAISAGGVAESITKLSAPVRWLVKDVYDSVKRMPAVRAPVLAIIAEFDESIPRSHSDALVAAIPVALRHSIVIPNGTHNNLGDFQQYLKMVRDFLAQ